MLAKGFVTALVVASVLSSACGATRTAEAVPVEDGEGGASVTLSTPSAPPAASPAPADVTRAAVAAPAPVSAVTPIRVAEEPALAAAAATAKAAAMAAARKARQETCRRPKQPFVPRRIKIPGVVGNTAVLALGSDKRGVPKTPPYTAKGKWQFAWDKYILAGERLGVLRLNAHTYPGSSEAALGNRLLAKMRVGKTIIVTGPNGVKMCYRVGSKVVVRTEQGAPAYYNDWVSTRMAILVCSGVRRGPGNWSHRTIWFAKPIGKR